MVGIAECRGQRFGEQDATRPAAGGKHQDHGKGRGEDRVRLFTFLVGEAEDGGFHAKGEDAERQGHVGVHVGAHAIFT